MGCPEKGLLLALSRPALEMIVPHGDVLSILLFSECYLITIRQAALSLNQPVPRPPYAWLTYSV